MSNHYHLLIETPQANLSVAIQWLNVSYSVYFNKRHRRRGHLFQDRFKAILLDANEYLILLSRYIHLNPVRAKMVTPPLAYSWSSYPVFAGKRHKPDWLTTETALSYFGEEKKEAIANYKSYVEKVNRETIIQSVCDEFGYREEQVKMRGRKDNKARAIAMYLARDLSGVSCKDIGAFFDGISGAAITMKYTYRNFNLVWAEDFKHLR